MNDFAAFRELVLRDAEVQDQLRAVTDPAQFVVIAVQIAAAHGIHVSVDEIERELTESRRSWQERTIL